MNKTLFRQHIQSSLLLYPVPLQPLLWDTRRLLKTVYHGYWQVLILPVFGSLGLMVISFTNIAS